MSSAPSTSGLAAAPRKAGASLAPPSHESVPEDAAPPDNERVRPWQFFVLAGLAAATAAVVMTRTDAASHMTLLAFAAASAAVAGFGLYRMLAPLTSRQLETPPLIAGSTRAALEREKTLTLRSIKELEFDRAMGKVSQQDFDEMSARLRARAMRLYKLLDSGDEIYRDVIEQDLDERVAAGAASGAQRSRSEPEVSESRRPVRRSRTNAVSGPRRAAASRAVEPTRADDVAKDESDAGSAPVDAPIVGPICPSCRTLNDADARFCKSCGARLAAHVH